MTTWSFPPGRHVLAIDDIYLRRALLLEPFRYATVAEYTQATGLSVDTLISQLDRGLDLGVLAVETAYNEVFVLTCPSGRPTPDHLPDVAPNLWEVLRFRRDVPHAARLWQIYRGLERAGWQVTAIGADIHRHTHGVRIPAPLGLVVANVPIPTFVGLSLEDVTDPVGPVADMERCGASAIAVICPGGLLDRYVTALRRHHLERRGSGLRATFLALESPGYQPVVLSPRDHGISPSSLSDLQLPGMLWGPSSQA